MWNVPFTHPYADHTNTWLISPRLNIEGVKYWFSLKAHNLSYDLLIDQLCGPWEVYVWSNENGPDKEAVCIGKYSPSLWYRIRLRSMAKKAWRYAALQEKKKIEAEKMASGIHQTPIGRFLSGSLDDVRSSGALSTVDENRGALSEAKPLKEVVDE